jgi:DNA-binding beta-propeller fold protein YncE
MRIRLTALASILPLLAACGDDSSSASTGSSSSGTGGGMDIESYLSAPGSCAYDCPNDACAEGTTPYACPALAEWSKIPHADTCPKWDGTYPKPVAGKCTASAPTGDALAHPGAGKAGGRELPDGRSNHPAGAEWAFDEADIKGGNTSAIVAVPGTPYVLTLDTGPDDHAVRVVDTSLIGKGSPVTAAIKFSPPSYLNSGIAFIPPGRAYVATDYGVVQALSFDPVKGTLSRDDKSSLTVPPTSDNKPFYASGVAASPDGKRLVVTAVNEESALVFDVDPASPTYLKQLGLVGLGGHETFGAYFDPLGDGSRAYVSMWSARKVIELDLSDATKPKVSRSFATDANPQGIAFLDSKWMAVANDFGETISLVDRVSGEVTPVPVELVKGLKGLDVSSVAWDASTSRLYALLAGINAVAAYDVDLKATPPKVTPAGKLPTSWWPSGVVVEPDGSLVVVNLRGHPIGPLEQQFEIGSGDGHPRMRGSVERIPAPTPADLAAGEKEVASDTAVGARPGFPTVDCPAGAMDFPVPKDNTSGPSKIIQHVFFIVRENKTFDSLLGDLPGADGEPKYMMKPVTAEADQIWFNFRSLARAFTASDNFYNLAVQSTQGHQWTTYGRATDFCERTWSADPRPIPLCGVTDVGRPEPGSLFEWLQNNKVQYDLLGEIVGNPVKLPADFNPIDVKYPGGPFQNITYDDDEKSCYASARVRVACDIRSFVYMTLPNDHTVGVSPSNPTPETMCTINDEATGMFVDALSHSPMWASSLVIITEDDPQQGGEHVDYHRTPIVFVSPWVKRKFVSKTHIDVASIHKLFAHIYGIPYPHLIAESAGVPFDIFTSTPDYTPFTYKPHTYPIACGAQATHAEKRLTDSWDFRDADSQPGLGAQVERWMRGQQLEALPPRLLAEVQAREARKKAGLPPEREDEDEDDR